MRYGDIIQRAAQIAWRHKVMWIFGIALALFSGGTVGSNGGSGLQYSVGQGDMDRWGRYISPNWQGILAAVTTLALIGAAVALVLVIVGIFVRYISTGALIAMADEADEGRTMTFGEGLREGWSQLLNVFLIALILGVIAGLIAFVFVLIFAVLGALIVVPAVAMFRANGGWEVLGVAWLVLLGTAFLAFLVVAIIAVTAAVTLTREYALRYAVLREDSVFDAIGAGYQLLRRRFRESVWLWFVLGFIQLAIALVLTPIMVLAAGAGIVTGLALWRGTESVLLALLVAAPLVLLGVLLSALVQGVIVTFSSTAWTLAFKELEALEPA